MKFREFASEKPIIEKKKKTTRLDNPIIKNQLIFECLKISLYTAEFLDKLSVKQLLQIVNSWKKKHFAEHTKMTISDVKKMTGCH